MKIQQFVFNGFQENTYVTSDDQKNCVIVDPGCSDSDEEQELAEYIESKINVTTEVYNPFSSIEMPDKFKNSQDPQLCLALGLAMRPE